MSLAHEAAPARPLSLARHDWTREEVRALFALPFPELMFRAAQTHRQNFDPTEGQISTLLSIKTGVCPEGLSSCAQVGSDDDRVSMIAMLAGLPVHPESVPINMLVQVEGTPLAAVQKLDPLDFVRTIAVARICMPASMVRLSAGREDMSEETQALCFLGGANSIFYGPKLLTTPNPGRDRDMALLDKLGMRPMD